jgi:hypothetical protein
VFYILKNVRFNAAKKFKRPNDPDDSDDEKYDNEVLTVTKRAALVSRLE